MRILVDTHLAIWSLINSNKLSKKAKDILENKNNELYISSISIWETELKHEIKPNDIILTGKDLYEKCIISGYKLLDFHVEQLFMLSSLELNARIEHKDPFDRMLISQSKYENMLFLTHDEKLQNYKNANITCV